MLHINDLTYRIEGRMLFDQATLAVTQGQKVGLIGRNGTGKSTLFRLIKGEIAPDDGSVNLRKNMRLGCVDQEVPSGPQSLIETVLAADTERSALLQEAQTETGGARLAQIYARLSDISAYSAEARGASILAGLGFSASDQLLPCSDFSGGWRMRVALAAMLFANPDLLLLDEPTNYLDVEGAVWLENHIRSYNGTALIISHDRSFLNTAVSHIAHLRSGKLFGYTGNYDQFEAILAEQQRLSNAQRAKQDDERRHLEAFVNRFRAQANKARQAQSRVKRLEKMKPVATIIDDPIPSIHLPSAKRPLNPPIFRFDNVALGYAPDISVLKRLNLRIDPDDRIGILGRNGEGKSTLAKSLVGEIAPQTGHIRSHKKLRIGYFAQHQIDALSPNKSAYSHIVELMPDATEAQRRSRLSQFGLGHAQAETPAGDLSGGEKARLLFSLIGFHKPHLLVLDEPANHLDMDSRAELIRSLNEFAGAIIVISHDRNMLEAVVDRLWLVSGGTVSRYEGSLDDYRAEQLDRERSDTKKSAKSDIQSKADLRRAAADIRAQLAPLKKSTETIETRIATLKVKVKCCEADLLEPDIYQDDPRRAALINSKRSKHLREIEALEDKWLVAAARYETAKSQSEAD
ncbi:ABC-F family ATP-binding cassette domain-containing protein [Robiginitomaculum antarcticum]|uniref:ABC-F family ATP-binding cassette domain-containing protein n=1 Tax=Robiginitomaculum antarcticum TaxID=437507 RepID=UPI000373C7FC|nr:ABC-F family ATP-binding cassette domain-containing protein [Robiginitomaculum antarcticum]